MAQSNGKRGECGELVKNKEKRGKNEGGEAGNNWLS